MSHVGLRYVTREGCMPHMNESCVTWTSHVTRERVVSRTNESCHTRMNLSQETCHTWMRHVAYERVIQDMNESCYTWTSHVTHERVMSRRNESRHTWMSHVDDMNEATTSLLLFAKVEYLQRDMTHPCVTWPIHTRYDTFCVSWTGHVWLVVEYLEIRDGVFRD